MKRVFGLFFTMMIMAVIGLTGCADSQMQDDNELKTITNINIPQESITPEFSDAYNDSKLHESTKAVSQSEETEPVADITAKLEKGTYTYNGIEFTGEYYFADYGNSFHLDENSLKTECGLSLSETSYNAALAFIAADTEKLLEYFDEEDAKRQLDYMEGWVKNKLDHLISLEISVGSTYFHDIENDDVALVVNYIAGFNDYDDIHAIWVSITMYLNDDGEWRVRHIDYTG